MSKILSLRVRRTREHRPFPFDRVYLVKYGDRHLLKELFRYALIMPVAGVLEGMLKAAIPEYVVDRPHNRDDEASKQKPVTSEGWNQVVDEDMWVMCLPILSKFFKDEIQTTPNYLAAKTWSTQAEKGDRREVFSNMSYLQTPTENIRPICSICPRFIYHQAGECDIGDKVCFDNLPLGSTDYIEEAVKAEEPSVNPFEEVVDASLRED